MGVSDIDGYTGGLIGLIYSAGPVAKAVVFILFVFSIISWSIIFYKLAQFKRVDREGERFIKMAGEADSFNKLISSYRREADNPFWRLLSSVHKEAVSKLRGNPGGIGAEAIPAIENIIKIVTADEIERLEKRLSFLATTANTAPFIGLFGTVWGIMDSFREIGLRGTTSLAVVAPGISEALIATAIGLATAIPAVLAYNYFVGRLKGVSSKMEKASLLIVNLLGK